jgi:poly(A) polymerase
MSVTPLIPVAASTEGQSFGPPSHVELSFAGEPDVIAVLDALETARFVGGAVRDGIIKRAFTDIDLATPLLPDEVIARLRHAGIKVVPTGLSHGTVTAVLASRTIEVTTLRKDVATDGRHAVVAFTEDWLEDASRRDFTINAIYADRQGKLFDPMRGYRDLIAKRVRFIGDPKSRIIEDYLRILRFFRFTAYYGADGFDEPGLRACADGQAGLDYLSAERVRSEVMKLLAAPDPMPSLRAMAEVGILARILPGTLDLDRLAALILAEHIIDAGDTIRRLAALCGPAPDLASRLRLSNVESTRIENLWLAPNVHALDSVALRRLIQLHGHEAIIDRVLMDRPKNWRALVGELTAWVKPIFPLKGEDALALGLRGRLVGAALKAVERQWIASDFSLERDVLLGLLEHEAQSEAEPAQDAPLQDGPP